MTEAMRKASNPDEVLDAAEKALWMRPRIISGEEEGKLTYRSVKEWHGEGIVTIDIGGGSTELSNGETKTVLWQLWFLDFSFRNLLP